MYLSKISVENFRLLENVELVFEKNTTLIVGRNNSGKTSLAELFKRILSREPNFRLEDFSLGVLNQFKEAFEIFQNDGEDAAEVALARLPVIRIVLTIDYEDDREDFGPISDFIIDIDTDCTAAQVVFEYRLRPGAVHAFFNDIADNDTEFFDVIRERVAKYYDAHVFAMDPNDSSNRKSVDKSRLQEVIEGGFVNAQRVLDTHSHGEQRVLGDVLENLFNAAAESELAEPDDRNIVTKLRDAVQEIQGTLDRSFNTELDRLLPAFKHFGYPGLKDPKLVSMTDLEVEQLLSKHTSVMYEGPDGIKLPEGYNGLGSRNLIYLFLKLVELYKAFIASEDAPGIQLVFIEEPEAHLHPQMQSVFIRNLSKVANSLVEASSEKIPWPVQFVVTTHSSHIANEAPFDTMRYFFTEERENGTNVFVTQIKDLKAGLGGMLHEDRRFLKRYMTLTQCDLLFADKAVLVEGASERLLFPAMVQKVDEELSETSRLSSQYLTLIEVGGAYAHIFYRLLDFLNLRSLIITDLDTVDRGDQGRKCKVSQGTHSSNQAINRWFTKEGESAPPLSDLLEKQANDKCSGSRRIAYQVPSAPSDACGRSFEDAFILENPHLFQLVATDPLEREEEAWNLATAIENKVDFALQYALQEVEWVVPRYIREGLVWLAQSNEDDQVLVQVESGVTEAASAQDSTYKEGVDEDV